jgi:methionine-rich copper-binding protein CopC
VKFESTTAGDVLGIRFYKNVLNTGVHTGTLWSASGTVLATGTFSGESASGWQTLTFATPVAIQANTIYVASYHTNTGYYASDYYYFTDSGADSGPLIAPQASADGGNGVYAIGSGGIFPTSDYLDTNYWVDVNFLPGGTTSPAVVAVSPTAGATGISTSAVVTLTFNEPLNSATVNSSTIQLLDSSGNVVSAVLAYAAGATSLTLTPSAALVAGMTYTVKATSGAQDSNGNSLTPFTSTFTTAAAAQTSFSLWSNSTVPSVVNESDPNAVEVGLQFESSQSGYITGIRFYKGSQNTGTHVGNLWSSTGTLLASATFYSETASGWQQVNFATPVLIAANTIYVASYHASKGYYSANTNYFTTSFTNGPLTANSGVYAYGSSSTFPSNTYESSNYWVDVVFSPLTGPVIPAVTAQTPASGATGVSPGTAITATFNEAVTAASIVFTLKDSSGNTIATTFSYNTTTNVATWTPTSPLKGSTTYTASITAATDANNNSLAAPVTWSFTTAAPVIPTVTAETPANGATGVSTVTTVTATFNEAVVSSSIVFTLTPAGGSAVATTLSYNSTTNVATWTPTATLKANTVYTASITAATDANNNSLAAPVTWSFTTAATNTWTQNVSSGFGSGTNSGTTVATGGVQLANEFSDAFPGTTLNSAWTVTSWASAGGGPLADSVNNGTFTIQGGQALATAQTLEPLTMVGTVTGVADQIIGLTTAGLLNSGISGAWFRTTSATALSAVVDLKGTLTTVSLGATLSGSHTYQIVPTTTGVQFLIDGTVKTTIAKVLATTSKYSPVISQYTGGTGVGSLVMTSVAMGYPTSGTFTSSVFDSGKTGTVWGTATWTSTLPTGTSFQILTRSGNTATPDGTWSAFAAVTNGGTIASPAGRYLQYEVIFATTNQLVTASLQSISIQWT